MPTCVPGPWRVRCWPYSRAVAEAADDQGSKAARRAAAELIGSYHQHQLRRLLEHVRVGLEQLDAGEVDEFELDDLIFHYKRAAAELWKFCAVSGSRVEEAASTLAYLRGRDEEPDWWERGRPRGRKPTPRDGSD